MAAPTVTLQPQRIRGSASGLERQLREVTPELPTALAATWLATDTAPVPADAKFVDTIKGLFPKTCGVPHCTLGSGTPVAGKDLKVGVVLSGGQAPGGHNVVAGIYDAVRRTGPNSECYGFLDGPHGIFSGNVTKFDDQMIDGYRNTGGFDMIGSGRHKIETPEQFEASVSTCKQLGLDGLIVIGGDDSNTNGALLAEYFAANNCKTKVVGCPKTIDGDLKCPPTIPVSFGFDTACRTYSELVGNVALDALSTQKYYHFCRLMGRSASNIALEVALQTHPNICLLGEEVQQKDMSLKEVTQQLVDCIKKRSQEGKNYGIVVLPEGLIEFIPEFNRMIGEINELGDGLKEEDVLAKLSPENSERFRFLPGFLRAQLLMDRDPHGNVQVAKIETEKLLASCVEQELQRLREAGDFSGSFQAQFHAFGYEGRAGLPSRFDATYCYVLGYTAGALLAADRTGLISSVQKLDRPVSEWVCGGVPITSLCVVERRKGKDKPVIRKALVELDGPLSQPFQAWVSIRDRLALEDLYLCPGPLQFDHACPFSLDLPATLALELGTELEPLPGPKQTTKNYGGFLFCPRPIDQRSRMQRWYTEGASLAHSALDAGSAELVAGETTAPPLSVDADAVKKALPATFGAPLVELRKKTLPATFEPPPRSAKPARVGIVFCGRQSPAAHDVLFGAVEAASANGGEVLGFVGGVRGLLAGHAVPLKDDVSHYRRRGGVELLGRTRDQLCDSEESMAAILASCKKSDLSGLVLLGGTRTATDAARLAEYFASQKASTSVVLVPCGIENSLLNPFVEATLGFDTAAKTVAQVVANTCTDGASARKYYYFLRCMDGSSTGLECTSHLSLEVALSVRPNIALATAEIEEKRLTLKDLANQIADVVCARAHQGKNFGTVVIPETLLAAVPETRVLLQELGRCTGRTVEATLPQLSQFSAALFRSLPSYMQEELVKERQTNGVVQLTQIPTEQLLADLVGEELKERKKQPVSAGQDETKRYVGSFSAVCQFVGYQARTSTPSNFDSEYGRTLGGTATMLAAAGHNGYFACVSGLASRPHSWRPAGAPISAICQDTDQGVRVVPKKVNLQGPAWNAWKKIRAECAIGDMYCNPGPVQLSGVGCDCVTETLKQGQTQWGEDKNYLGSLDHLRSKIEELSAACRPGCETRLARAAGATLTSMEEILSLMREQS